ncbi:EVA1C protein, partial [Polypterus senegalus]
MLDECQDRRSCQLLVNSRLFGVDPCPGTSKYLIVWYKCRPNEYKSKVACEEDRLRLSCKRSMVIAIYSAIFGRSQEGSLECPYHNYGVPPVDCLSGTALQIMTSRCHGKRSCNILANSHEFGDPCYPGIRKYLNVIYTCENPERAALYFVSGVCIGLILTLCALVVQISCRTDCRTVPVKKQQKHIDSDSDSSDSDSNWDTTSDLSARRHRRFERTLNMNVFTSAEELERAQRLEERERIIREIWMNGQPDIPGTRSLNRYY